MEPSGAIPGRDCRDILVVQFILTPVGIPKFFKSRRGDFRVRQFIFSGHGASEGADSCRISVVQLQLFPQRPRSHNRQ